MLAESTGWHIAWDEMDPKHNEVASVAAYNSNEVPLQDMLRSIVSPNPR
jgi:hypothetical protein